MITNTSGVIYQYQQPIQPDQLLLEAYEAPALTILDESKAARHKGIHKVFNALIAGGLVGLFVLFSPLLYVEAKYRVATFTREPEAAEQLQNVEQKLEVTMPEIKTPTFTHLINDKYLRFLNPVDANFSIVIPKLAINSRVISEVDAGNRDEYSAVLKQGAAHAKGTYLPGQRGRTFLFAHSTDYVWNITQFNAVFYLLKELVPGDQVHIVYQGKVFPYEVTERLIVEPSDTSYMEPETGYEELVLQTCWPPGTTAKRLIIIAEPVQSPHTFDANL